MNALRHIAPADFASQMKNFPGRSDERKSEAQPLVERVASRTFYRVGDRWVDAAYDRKTDTKKIELFSGMTVLDNIRLGRHIHLKANLLDAPIYLGRVAREEVEHRRFIEEEIIDLLEIEHIRHSVVGMLPYGLQKRVELGRALALKPKILLLDEPMAGLNLEEVEDMARFILDVNEEERWQVTCVLVEHDMGVVMDISDRVAALNFGEKIAEGTPDEVQRDPRVLQAYLGEVEDLYVSRR
jgi:branched-chain amino acid transport system ATP-binding protein